MKIANQGERAVIVVDGKTVDVGTASGDRFGPDVDAVLADWTQFRAWASGADLVPDRPYAAEELGPVVNRPGSVFAVGLNYRLHAEEAGLPIPEVPLVFTKFPSSIAAPEGILDLPTDQVDWEVEVAVVIGTEAHRVSTAEAWEHVAGITAAQDFSARDVQLAGGAKPQFSLGKSFTGFTPLGPLLVTPDEYEDRDAIGLSCSVNGAVLQDSTTADLIFSIPVVVSYLSHILALRPGDVILTGTPSGVGLGFEPPRFLRDGDEVVTTVELVGEMRHACRAADRPFDAPALLG